MEKIRAHTILFTEDCPLDCRYCQLKLESDYHKFKTTTFEEILKMVQNYRDQDIKDGFETQFTFTGGEPFLYWEWIKEIIEKVKNMVVLNGEMLIKLIKNTSNNLISQIKY